MRDAPSRTSTLGTRLLADLLFTGIDPDAEPALLGVTPSRHLPGLKVLGPVGAPIPQDGSLLVGVLSPARGSIRTGLALAAEALRRGREPLWLDPMRLGCPGSRALERLVRLRGLGERLAGFLPYQPTPGGAATGGCLRWGGGAVLARLGTSLLGGIDPGVPLLSTHPWVTGLAADRPAARVAEVGYLEIPEVARYAAEDGEARIRRAEQDLPPRLLLPAAPDGPGLRWTRRAIARLAPRVRAGEVSLLLDAGGDHGTYRAWMETVSRQGITGREMLSLREAERLVDRGLLGASAGKEPAGASIIHVPRPLPAALVSSRLIRCADLLLVRAGTAPDRPAPTLWLGPPDGPGSLSRLERVLDRPGSLRQAAEEVLGRVRRGAYEGARRALDALPG